MCDFIMVTLPQKANVDAVRALAIETYGRQFKPLSQNWKLPVAVQDHWYLTTRGHCDCGTALGRLRRGSENEETPEEIERQQRQTLENKGWSKARIARWFAEREKAADAKAHRQDESPGMSAARWKNFLSDALSQKMTPQIGLMVWWPDFEDGGFVVPVRLKSLTPELLGQMERNVLYQFTP